MGLVIESGITVGSGITISSGLSPLLTLLSPAGQAAWTAAANTNWFSVSAADYANVVAGLSGVSTIGYSDAQLTGSVSSFSQNFGATLDQTNATVTAGNYVLGFASRAQGGPGSMTFSPYISTSFRGAYVTLGGNTVTMSATASPTYWLAKNPTQHLANRYVALGVPFGGATVSWAGTGTWGSGATGGAYSSTMTSWTSFNTGLPAQQWLLTNVQQW